MWLLKSGVIIDRQPDVREHGADQADAAEQSYSMGGKRECFLTEFTTAAIERTTTCGWYR